MERERSYQALYRSGELGRRAQAARLRQQACDLCGHGCGIDRATRAGACRTGQQARLASAGPHHGEEDPLRGWRGSGTLFFGGCNLHCVYCQNHDISQRPAGPEVDAETLAAAMLGLQQAGCHNLNLVSPSHVVAEILEALVVAAGRGLRLPLVYNTGGFDSPAALALLDGVVDIYMPDVKYADPAAARRYSHAADYVRVNRAALREMHRQVGDLELDEEGLAVRGLLVRHLVLPGGLAGTADVVRFLAQEISPHTYLNLMAQYRPAYRAREFPPLNRPLQGQEYREALGLARAAGLSRLDGLPSTRP